MIDTEIEVFRAGTRASRGITAERLASVAAFDCAANPIPICIGHPRDDTPAQGSIAGFRLDGSKLFAKLKGVSQKVVDGIKDGSLLNRSMAFFGEDHEANPTPGKLAPRHLGFLGGSAPGIPGMPPLAKALAFAADDDTGETLIIEGEPAPAMLFEAEPTGVLSVTDAVFDAGDMGMVAMPAEQHAKAKKAVNKALEMHKARMNGSAPKSGAAGDKHRADIMGHLQDAKSCLSNSKTFAATEELIVNLTPEQIAENDRITAASAALDTREEAIAARLRSQFEASNNAAVDALVRQTKVLPAEADALKTAFNALDPEAEELTFGAGDKATKASAGSHILAFMAANLPKRVPIGERQSPTGQFDATGDAPKTGADFNARADALAKEKNITFSAAAEELANEIEQGR